MRCLPWLLPMMLLAAHVESPAAQARSPVQDLIASARGALNDLRFADADSITSVVLNYPQLRRSDRIQALQIAAGSLYPEQEAARKRDRAIEVLERLIRLAPSALLPREVSWAGLDELYREAARRTFGASATVRGKTTLTGPDENVEIDVVASRPATFMLYATPAGGRPVALDSLVAVERGSLRFKVMVNGMVRLAPGSYELAVSAIDAARPDTILLRYDAVIDAPPLETVAVPEQFPPSALLPEVTSPKRALGIVTGLIVAAGTIVASSAFRDNLSDVARSDGRAVGLGLSLGVITAGGVWLLDHGAPIEKNIMQNRESRQAFDLSVMKARTINEDRIRAYRAEVTINPEPR